MSCSLLLFFCHSEELKQTFRYRKLREDERTDKSKWTAFQQAAQIYFFTNINTNLFHLTSKKLAHFNILCSRANRRPS